MKKIIILSLVALLSYGANAFAGALATTTASTAGAAIFGGADTATAANMQNRLVSLSKGVQAAVTYQASATNTSTNYVVITKHNQGTKLSGTSNDSTKLYWKQSAVGDLTAGIPTSDTGTVAFAVGSGWTEY